MKKLDVIIIIAIFCISGIAYGVITHLQDVASKEVKVVIKHQGEIIKTIPFDDNTIETFVYDDGDERNVVSIGSGIVTMSEANCRDQICVKTGEISKVGEVIVCLPHKFTVEIASDTETAALDSIAE